MNVGKILLDLQECLCAAIEEKVAAQPEYRGVCSCSVMWSEVAMLDYCGPDVECGDGCGQAWVRFVSLGPDPQVDASALRCTYAFQVTLEVGIGRCSATYAMEGGEIVRFDLPSDDAYLADVITATEDMDVITRAVMCCGDKHRGNRMAITSMIPAGPEGGCFGTVAEVTMQVLV